MDQEIIFLKWILGTFCYCSRKKNRDIFCTTLKTLRTVPLNFICRKKGFLTACRPISVYFIFDISAPHNHYHNHNLYIHRDYVYLFHNVCTLYNIHAINLNRYVCIYMIYIVTVSVHCTLGCGNYFYLFNLLNGILKI